METNTDHVRLVKQAQHGDKECIEHLSRLAEESLRSDVYRMTFERDLTEDIVQETILEMLKILGDLKEPDRFWRWLYKMALNKIRLHRRSEKRRRAVPISSMPDIDDQKAAREAMSNLVADELRQIVAKTMRQLRPQHREVLTLRCYKEMEYPAIAEVMGCSEFAAGKLFWRAKKSLARQLARHGFGKGSLLMALVLFGKLTAPTEAAAAQVSVTAGATKVGAAAALAGMATGTTAVVSLATAGVIGVGALVATSGPGKTAGAPVAGPATNAQPNAHVRRPSEVGEEYWYYFPKGRDGAMMMRAMKKSPKNNHYFCQWVQDAEANYYFDRRRNAVHINNYRQWHRDLAVWQIPTDRPALTDFLSRLQGATGPMQYVSDDGPGLVVVVSPAANGTSSWTTRHHRMLEEDYFIYNWPTEVQIVDNRDAMHERGWAYFRIEGRIDGDRVSGAGRIPFVYAAAAEHHPWLKLNIADRLEIIDDGRQAITRRGRKVTASYGGGSFFAGLSRPWMGLHTIDTVRRDAASEGIRFETTFDSANGKAEVELHVGETAWAEAHPTSGPTTVSYVIDMENDVVERITISAGQGLKAELRFSYLQDVEQAGYKFTEPRITRRYDSLRRKNPGMLWLLQILANQERLIGERNTKY